MDGGKKEKGCKGGEGVRARPSRVHRITHQVFLDGDGVAQPGRLQ